MIGHIETGTLQNAEISAVVHEGFKVTTPDGKPAQLAIIDADGKVIEIGATVQREAFNVAIAAYKQMLKGMGHIRVFSERAKKAA